MKLGQGLPVSEYTVFLSSANDALELRSRVEGLFENAVQPILKLSGADVRFYLDTWHKSEPRRLEEGETIDDEFVDRAVASNLTLTLLVERLGPGTIKEIEAVLDSGTEISMLWFINRDEEQPDTDLGRFMSELEERDLVRYTPAGRPDTKESWEAIVRTLLAAIFAAIEPPDEEHYEDR